MSYSVPLSDFFAGGHCLPGSGAVFRFAKEIFVLPLYPEKIKRAYVALILLCCLAGSS